MIDEQRAYGGGGELWKGLPGGVGGNLVLKVGLFPIVVKSVSFVLLTFEFC